jgi:hypothetical protein
MTKKNFEKILMNTVKKLYLEYKGLYPDGDYLSLTVVEMDGHTGYDIHDNHGIINLYEADKIISDVK